MKKLLLLALLPLSSTLGCGGTECGTGTVEQDGQCVVNATDTCGTGTKLENGVCVPEVNLKCGDGTMLVMGECRPDGTGANCAMGTMLQNGQCVPSADACGVGTTLDATGVCIPDGEIVCGMGTMNDGMGNCVPDPANCAPGTAFEPATGLCVPDVMCPAGEVAVNGLCLTPEEIDASNADVTESMPDDNDPSFGGTPETLPTPIIGDSTIFTGQIGTPMDLNGDGDPDQDWDYWSFDATAGNTFEIVLRALGSTQLGFVVTGPNGYRRLSPLYFEAEPSRYMVAPYDGTYTIAVAPQLRIENLAQAGPEGGDDYDYVVVLEQEPFPTATDLDKNTQVSGNMRNLTDNLYLVKADANDLVRIEFPVFGRDGTPVILLFDGAGNFQSQIDPPADGLVHRAAAADDLHVMIDWTRLVGTNDEFDVVSIEVLPNDVGPVLPDTTLTSSTATVAAGEVGYFEATITAGQVVEISVAGGASAPDLRVLAPGGGVAASALDSRTTRFYAGVGGRYSVEVTNDDVTDDQYAVTFTSISPIVLSPIGTAGATTATAAGYGDLNPDANGYFVVQNVDPIEATVSISQQTFVNLGLFVFNTDFDPLRGVANGGAAPTLSAFLPNAGRVIVEVINNSPVTAAIDVVLDAEAAVLPPLEAEPNDDSTTATPLALDTPLFGEVVAGDDDFFRITLAQALSPTEILEVRALEPNNQDDYTCQLQDGTGAILEEQTPRAQGCLVFGGPGLGAGDYFFRLQKAGNVRRVYQVIARVVPGVREVEPNDAAPGTVITDLTGAVPMYGEIPLNIDTDVYSFTLAAPLAADEFIEVLIEEVGTRPTGTMSANLSGPGINAGVAVDPIGSIIRVGLDSGEYTLTISRTSANASFDGHHRITITTNTITVTDTEPNDDPATQAQDLGMLPSSATGFIAPPTTGDDDWYSFTLPADLPADQAVVARLFRTGANPSNSLRVAMFDAGQNFLVASNAGDPRVIREPAATAGTYFIRVDATFNTSIDTDYVLLVTVE